MMRVFSGSWRACSVRSRDHLSPEEILWLPRCISLPICCPGFGVEGIEHCSECSESWAQSQIDEESSLVAFGTREYPASLEYSVQAPRYYLKAPNVWEYERSRLFSAVYCSDPSCDTLTMGDVPICWIMMLSDSSLEIRSLTNVQSEKCRVVSGSCSSDIDEYCGAIIVEVGLDLTEPPQKCQ